MRRPILAALMLDAWYQVLDNRVFRLLLGVVALLVLPTFLIGFHSTGIELLFGLGSLDYASVYEAFPEVRGIVAQIEEPGAAIIQVLQDLVVTSLAGTLGVVFAIAATAFFMPRMMEKGSADTIFSKPVSRGTLLFSRYVSGLLFVGALSFLLVFGMYTGFRVTSGYDDKGFLWSALTLVYLYSALHAFSLLVATFTRSSVAAILLTIVLFSFSGCVHSGWIAKEQFQHDERMQAMFETVGHATQVPDAVAEDGAAEDGAAEGAEAVIEADAARGWGEKLKDILLGTLEVLHYTLPKTTDADILVRKLKRSFEVPTNLEDPVGQIAIARPLRGWDLQRAGRVDLASEPAIWLPAEAETEVEVGSESESELGSFGELRLSRRSRRLEENGRPRALTSLAASADLLEALRADPTALEPARESRRLKGVQTYVVRWSDASAEPPLARERWILAYRDHLFELDATLPPELARENARWRRDLQRYIALGEDAGHDVSTWYERQFRLDAPLRYNPLFSIGSTLAFALLALLLGRWKLDRVDF